MIESFINAVDMAEDDPSILAVIITGEGRAFCSGGNVKQMLERETSDLTVVLPGGAVADVMDGPIGVRRGYIRGLQRVTRRLDRFDKPLVVSGKQPLFVLTTKSSFMHRHVRGHHRMADSSHLRLV